MDKLIDAFSEWTREYQDTWAVIRFLFIVTGIGLLVRGCSWAWSWLW